MSATWTISTKSGPGETRWHCWTAVSATARDSNSASDSRRLAVERDLDDRGQPVAERLGREQGDPALDDAGVDERLDTAQAGRRRGVDPLSQGLVGQRGVALELVEDLEVGGVDRHGAK